MNKKIIGLSISILILLSCAIVVTDLKITNQTTKNNSVIQPLSSNEIDVQISPDNAKLYPNEVGTFVANVTNAVGKISYYWKVECTSGIFEDYEFVPNNNIATFTFKSATEKLFMLSVEVVDSLGNKASDNVIVKDPFTSSDIYINELLSAGGVQITADGNGWFKAVNTTTGSTISETISANTTLNSGISNGGIIIIRNGNYSGAQLDVPATAHIIAEPSVYNITYLDVADGAIISEPSFNDCFGDYQSGSYTVVANQTSTATNNQTLYLAFKPDSSIYWTSTNAATVTNDALTALNGLKGVVYMIGNNIIVNATDSETCIRVPTNATLAGDASLYLANGANAAMIYVEDATDVEISGLTLNGNSGGQTTWAEPNCVILASNNVNGLNIHDITAYSPKYAVCAFNNTNNLLFSNNEVRSSGNRGMKLALSQNVTVTGNQFRYIGEIGLHIESTTGFTVSGNNFDDCDSSGIEVKNAYSTVFGSITGNTITRCGSTPNAGHYSDGISLGAPTASGNCSVTVTGNTVSYNYGNGVNILSKATGCTVSGNTIFNNGLVSGNYNGVNCSGYNNTIIGNTIYDDQTNKTQQFSIALLGGSGNVAFGNNLYGSYRLNATTWTRTSGECFDNNGVSNYKSTKNLIYGISPTASSWGVDPANLAYCVDGDGTTYAGTGTRSHATALGSLTWDLGETKVFNIGGKFGVWSNASTVYIRWQTSTDGVTYINSGSDACSVGATSERLTYAAVSEFPVRYMRITFFCGAAMDGNVNIYEVYAMSLS